MYINNKILVGKNDKKEVNLLLNYSNRHGIITGASGTGKTITSKVMAESFSDAGVPVFMADVKGDLAGTCMPGEMNENITKRVENLKLTEFDVKEYPVRFWDIFSINGHPIRTKISSVGPDILSIMLGLSEAQEGILNILFKIAEDEDLPLVDLKDLKSALNYIGENRKEYTTTYGNITTQSIGVILRSLMSLENQGIDNFFGEPSLDIKDFISFDNNGKGIINILDSVELYKHPDLYSAIMLWLFTELYNKMPEVGDVEKPKIVFFFDEAYFLFRDMPSFRLKQIEKIVRLIRSKGIGLFFITHYTTDIPDTILEQLGNRVQHNLRAYTPSEIKTAKAASDAFRVNPDFKTYDAILELATGEALVSFQNEKGEPEIVERVTILPPQSKIGTIDSSQYNKIINNSPLVGKYDEVIDNESAYEKISKINEEKNKEKLEKEKQKQEEKLLKEEAKKKKEEQRARKNNPYYKVGKRVASRVEGRLITKIMNAIFKSLKK